MFKLNAKFDTDSLLYLLSHFECGGHTGHMLTQWRLPPSLTSTVKSSLFMHIHSSSLFLSARLHGCHANCSHYSNNSWTFSGSTIMCTSVWIYDICLYITLTVLSVTFKLVSIICWYEVDETIKKVFKKFWPLMSAIIIMWWTLEPRYVIYKE